MSESWLEATLNGRKNGVKSCGDPARINALGHLLYDFSFTFSDNRPISGSIGTTWGDYYGGDYYSLYSSVWWLPMPLLACGTDYSYSDFKMPNGDISSHLLSLLRDHLRSPVRRDSRFTDRERNRTQIAATTARKKAPAR